MRLGTIVIRAILVLSVVVFAAWVWRGTHEPTMDVESRKSSPARVIQPIEAVQQAAFRGDKRSAARVPTDRSPTTRPNVLKTKTVEQSAAAELMPILHSGKPESERMRDILSFLAKSGPPTDQFAQTGHQLATELTGAHLIDNNWNCYNAGCYFSIDSSLPHNESSANINKIRISIARDTILIVTGTTPETRLGILIDAK